jgi:hypothetical protein
MVLQLAHGLGEQGSYYLRILLLLVEHRHKPIVQAQFARAHDPAAIGVAQQSLLPG